MVSIVLKSPYEMKLEIASRVRAKRLLLNWSQRTLSKRSGVSYGTLKKFESTGQISLESLLKLAIVLGEFEKFDYLFVRADGELPATLDELIEEDEKQSRKRGRE